MSDSDSELNAPSSKRRAPDAKFSLSPGDPPSATIWSLSDDIMISVTASVNDIDDLSSLFLSCKKFVALLSPDETWRELMRRRSWHPRWAFDYYTSETSLNTPDKWRREYLWSLRQCMLVWKGFKVIKKWILQRDEELHDVLFPSRAGPTPTPESHFEELERKINHPIPNDLKELMRMHPGFFHTEKTWRTLVEAGDNLEDWGDLLLIKPVADWKVVTFAPDEFFLTPMMYNHDEISEDLPLPDGIPYDEFQEMEDAFLAIESNDESSSYEAEASTESEDVESDGDEPPATLTVLCSLVVQCFAFSQQKIIGNFVFAGINWIQSDFNECSDPQDRLPKGQALHIQSGLLQCDAYDSLSVSFHFVYSISDLMELAIQRIHKPEASLLYENSSETSSSSENEDMSSLDYNSLDEDEREIARVVKECARDYGSGYVEITEPALKLLANTAQQFVIDAFRASGVLEVEPGMLNAQARKMLPNKLAPT